MLTITTVLFDATADSTVPDRSRVFTPEWVDKLYRGCWRNLTVPFEFVVVTHYPQEAFIENVRAVPFLEDTREMMCLTEVFRPDLEIDRGLFIALDTVILANIDHLATYKGKFALPRIYCGSYAMAVWENPICLYSGKDAACLWENRHKAAKDPDCLKMLAFGVSEMLYWAKYGPGTPDDIHAMFPLSATSFEWWRDGDNPRGDVQPALPATVRMRADLVYFFGEEKPHNTTLTGARAAWT